MRIKDLATRATKLLTGNAYMVFDNGTKVEKVDYAELAKQIITEYNTQTLAGSAQSVKAALDALNSKPTVNAIQKNNISLDTLTTPGVYACNNCTETPNGWTSWLNVQVLPNGSGGDGNTDYAIQIATPLNSNDIYIRHRSSGTWGAWEKEPTRTEINNVSAKTGGFTTSLGVDMNQNKTYEITTSQGYPIYFMFGQATGGSPFAVIIGGGGLTTANPTVYYQTVGSPTIIESVTAEPNKIIIKFSNNYAQFTLMSRQEFTGQVKP